MLRVFRVRVNLQAADDADQGRIGTARIAAPIGAPPEGLDMEGLLALQVLLKNVLDHGDHDRGREGGAVDLPKPGHAVVAGQLDEEEIAAAVVRRRVADDEGFQLPNAHARPLPAGASGSGSMHGFPPSRSPFFQRAFRSDELACDPVVEAVGGTVHDGGKLAAVELVSVTALLHALDHADVLHEDAFPEG